MYTHIIYVYILNKLLVFIKLILDIISFIHSFNHNERTKNTTFYTYWFIQIIKFIIHKIMNIYEQLILKICPNITCINNKKNIGKNQFHYKNICW